ncbi:MAG: hypothetical protein WC006_04100 [Bacilli bacterium]
MSTFDGVVYDGSIVNMGIKNPNVTIYYIIGIKVSLKNLPFFITYPFALILYSKYIKIRSAFYG